MGRSIRWVKKLELQSGRCPPVHPRPCLVHFLPYFLVHKKARNIRAESSRGLSRLCGESSNVLMLHMVTSGPSRGPTSSPHTEDRRSTSQGLSHILCARTCCPWGFTQPVIGNGNAPEVKNCGSRRGSCLKLLVNKLSKRRLTNFSAIPNTNQAGL